MYFLGLILAATIHPNTGQPVHSLLFAPMQAAHDGPDQAPTGVNNKTLMTPASAGSGQQTQLHALANAHWKPNTQLHFKPHFSFVFWNDHLNKTVVSAWLNTQTGTGYGQSYRNSKECESTGWARQARNWLLSAKCWLEETEHMARGENPKVVSHHGKLYPFLPLFPPQLSQFSMEELGMHTAWQGR